MSCKILHVADVHWRGLNRHDEFKRTFEDLALKIKQHDVKHVFVAGDIFHTKTMGITPEYIDQMIWWLNKLTEGDVMLHMILGNHDGNLVNATRQDAISPIVNALKNPNVKLYKKSGVYEFEPGMNWCVFSLFDEHGWKNVKPQPGAVNIACYHGPVLGSVSDVGWEIDDGLAVDFFKDYDFAFLGDIHAHQFLGFRDCIKTIDASEIFRYPNAQIIDELNDNKLQIIAKKPWIGYPGSIIQQGFGENVDDHGFILWDIKSRADFDVQFYALKNHQPFVTIDWQGNVESTLLKAKQFPSGSRFRIRHDVNLTHHDVTLFTQVARSELSATDVTFKNDALQSTMLQSSDVYRALQGKFNDVDYVLKLIKEYNNKEKINEEEWSSVKEILEGYYSTIGERPARNTKWSIVDLKFDNLFSYGEKNHINFAALKGIVGIFGPNRIGKSSIPGALMYSLFNTSDRGALKNIDICNIRKDFCYARMVLNVNGIHYVSERQTTKNESKRGITASTSLNLFKVGDDNELIDMCGEQRLNTETTLRELIGGVEDFVLTSLATQGELNQLINLGSAKRKQLFARFLDLDIFEQLHDLVRTDVNLIKGGLKQIPAFDFDSESKRLESEICKIQYDTEEIDSELERFRELYENVKQQLVQQQKITPVSGDDVLKQKEICDSLSYKLGVTKQAYEAAVLNLSSLQQEITNINDNILQFDEEYLQKNVDAISELEHAIKTLRLAHEKQENILNTQKKSLKMLDDVPCGDQFPKCKFICHAHETKPLINEQNLRTSEAFIAVQNAEQSIKNLRILEPEVKLSELNRLKLMRSNKLLQESNLKTKLVSLEIDEHKISLQHESEIAKFDEMKLKVSLINDKKIQTLKNELTEYDNNIRSLESEKKLRVTNIGRLQYEFEALKQQQQTRNDLYRKMKLYELLNDSLSKKGIPNMIINVQLPLINVEIAKILHGIVDYTVELALNDSEQLEIYLNYGDSRRIIELGSGMEKAISSIAIRAAMINISTLPKTDMFFIDEGFGVFDDVSVEICNRLLVSLKNYFKTIFVITHVDAVKDVADHVIDVVKQEKDSHVLYD